MECANCGIAPCDLPDGVDPDDVFIHDGDEVWCEPCFTGHRLTIAIPTTTED